MYLRSQITRFVFSVFVDYIYFHFVFACDFVEKILSENG